MPGSSALSLVACVMSASSPHRHRSPQRRSARVVALGFHANFTGSRSTAAAPMGSTPSAVGTRSDLVVVTRESVAEQQRLMAADFR
jgi:hypothetical protein